MNTLSTPPLRVAWLMWGLCALLYLMGFFQRVSPAVMTEELMRDFKINAAALGNLSAVYFYSYVLMQIPTGIIADTWGPRRLLSLGALVAGIGILLFALAPAYAWAGWGRFLIGGSVAVAFVGLLKVASSWFPQRYFALVAGMALFFGVIGAVSAGPPLRLGVTHFGWRPVMLVSALLTVAVAVAIWLFVRDTPHEKGYADHIPAPVGAMGSTGSKILNILHGLVDVFRYRNTPLLLIVPAGIIGSVLTFAGLWGVPFLTTAYGLSVTQAAGITSAFMVALAAGGPCMGWLSDRYGRRKRLYLIGSSVALTGWIVAVYATRLPLPLHVVVLLMTGFCSGCMIIGFAMAKESVPQHLAGTVSGVINTGVMLGPTVLQPAVGWMLDRHWHGATHAGVRVYTIEAYQAGFNLMIALSTLSLVLLLFTRETHCRQQVE